jgi:thermostable 8-oxoguanine DNA glycosylase
MLCYVVMFKCLRFRNKKAYRNIEKRHEAIPKYTYFFQRQYQRIIQERLNRKVVSTSYIECLHFTNKTAYSNTETIRRPTSQCFFGSQYQEINKNYLTEKFFLQVTSNIYDSEREVSERAKTKKYYSLLLRETV